MALIRVSIILILGTIHLEPKTAEKKPFLTTLPKITYFPLVTDYLLKNLIRIVI